MLYLHERNEINHEYLKVEKKVVICLHQRGGFDMIESQDYLLMKKRGVYNVGCEGREQVP